MTLYQDAVKKYGVDGAAKMYQQAVDPKTGYIAKTQNRCHMRDGLTPCRRCGLPGLWEPGGITGPEVTLCVRCGDDWDAACIGLLTKHKYVSSTSKWLAAFAEFCATVPEVIDIEAHNRQVQQSDLALRSFFPKLYPPQ